MILRIIPLEEYLHMTGALTPQKQNLRSIYILIACCYGVARFIVQNKQATTLWSGSRDLYRV